MVVAVTTRVRQADGLWVLRDRKTALVVVSVSPLSPNSCLGRKSPHLQERATWEASLMNPVSLYVGIDVSKARLDLAVRPTSEHWSISNDEVEIAQLVTRLQALAPTLIVLEATGGLELPVAAAL